MDLPPEEMIPRVLDKKNMSGSLISLGIQQLGERALSGGGFALRPGGGFRPDATAWAVIALTDLGAPTETGGAARRRLAAEQQVDGRVSVSRDHPEAFWPTSLAALAWQGASEFKPAQTRAVDFLLATFGLHREKDPGPIVGHDPDLKGWPWRAGTSPWVEPTALTLMALQAAGYGGHQRVAEAVRLLLDRQLPEGGWNYGNTTVFGQVLHPLPESTGMVLTALGPQVPRHAVQKSLDFLDDRVTGLKTPWSLGWGLLGLSAWGRRPTAATDLIAACLARQERFGGYDTSSLALLLVASQAGGGLVSLFQAGALDPS